MNQLISRKNVISFVAQRYGISMKELFKAKEKDHKFFEYVMEVTFEEFASAFMHEDGNTLHTFNPHTQELEEFSKTNIGKVASFQELMESLSNTHRERMTHLNKSFYQELKMEKDIDKEQQKKSRTTEIESLSKDGHEKEELER